MRSRWIVLLLSVLFFAAYVPESAASPQGEPNSSDENLWKFFDSMLETQHVGLWQMLATAQPVYGLFMVFEPIDDTISVIAIVTERNGTQHDRTIYMLERKDIWTKDPEEESQRMSAAIKAAYAQAVEWQKRGLLKTQEQNAFSPTVFEAQRLNAFMDTFLREADDLEPDLFSGTLTVDHGKKYFAVTVTRRSERDSEEILIGRFPFDDLLERSQAEMDLIFLIHKAASFSAPETGSQRFSPSLPERDLRLTTGGLYFLAEIL